MNPGYQVPPSGLFTDFYELTMMQGFFLSRHNPHAVFEMFYRKQPFNGGFSVFAGLGTLLEYLEGIRFTREDTAYLKSTGKFREHFLDYLLTLRFTGDVHAPAEGEIVFPREPLIRIEAPLIEAQWVESLVLNIINFQTLIATKTRRICTAAGNRPVLEFGLRRAHGPDGAVSGTRAAYVGGAGATSNTLAGKLFDIPVKGTMAHSWVMSFGDELTAFRRYAEIYPEGCILLVDTYDTLEQGVKNAVQTAKSMGLGESSGFGVRLDSGDPATLCRKVRTILDAEGLSRAKIVVSNDLDENVIAALVDQDVPVDVFGVGTRLVTAWGDPALGGVYKLISVRSNEKTLQVLKLSDDPGKQSLPGSKQVLRCFGTSGSAVADIITGSEEELEPADSLADLQPLAENRNPVDPGTIAWREALVFQCMKEGERLYPALPLSDIREFSLHRLSSFSEEILDLDRPSPYPLFLSEKLSRLKDDLTGSFHS